jgi:hypothetical protein
MSARDWGFPTRVTNLGFRVGAAEGVQTEHWSSEEEVISMPPCILRSSKISLVLLVLLDGLPWSPEAV